MTFPSPATYPSAPLPFSGQADLLRLVELSAGGRPVEVLALEDGVRFWKAVPGVKITAPAKTPQLSKRGGRFGGSVVVGESQDNGELAVTLGVRGTDPDDAQAAVELLLGEVEEARRGRFLEWALSGGARSRLFEVMGPGTWVPSYNQRLFRQRQAFGFDVSWPVAPLARRLPMDVWDDFAALDAVDDYVFDSGDATLVQVLAGQLKPAGTLTTERRMVHAARGYAMSEGVFAVKGAPGATLNGFKLGRALRRQAADTYIDVYVDDNGTNSRLRIDVVLAGVRTNRASVNLAARVSDGAALWVRPRIEGQTVFADHFTSEPSPMGTPTTVSPAGGAGYTLSGAEQTALPAGPAGLVWIPQHANAWVDDYRDEPYRRRNVTLPAKISPADPIPGNAPALVDWELTPSGGAAAPVWALLALLERPSSPIAGSVPFGLIEAETAADLAGWAAGTDSDASGGNSIRDLTPTSAETYTASWLIDPSTVEPDEFSDREVAVEVWARVRLSSSLVSPKLTLSARPSSGVGAERFAEPHGTQGQVLAVPSSGAVRRFVPLGTLSLPADLAQRQAYKLWLAGSLGAGSGGGDWGIDRLLVLPLRSRVSGPTDKPNDANFPKFVTVTTEVRKRILSDRRGLAAAATGAFAPDTGLSSGAHRIEIEPGLVDLLVKLSSLVPRDPTADTTTEQLSHTASVHLSVQPRDFLVSSP